MLAFLQQLFSSRKYRCANVVLRVIPEATLLSIEGFVELRAYEGSEEKGKQVKKSLQEIAGDNLIVHVKSHPCMLYEKESLYEFNAALKLASKEELESELQQLKKAGALGEHFYTIEAKWAKHASGN